MNIQTDPRVAEASFLLVDDDAFASDILQGALHSLGVSRIQVALDASSAEQLARQHRPDFVLLDIYMPEVDGWELLQRLRQCAPQATVLMVTGSSRADDLSRSIQEHADGYCIKPVLPDVLHKALLMARGRRLGPGR